ncbi:MAG: transposase [Verrucomicrobia subdivision 3 bacterium]|nr:transposase [Limisphaerales bacterium]
MQISATTTLCRPPLHERQLERWDAQHVSFRYRANGGEVKRTTVSGEAFVRRFLQHVLPKGFQRVRHYGWLGAAAQARRQRIGALLDWRPPALVAPLPLPPPQCPGCGQVMRLIGSVARKPP